MPGDALGRAANANLAVPAENFAAKVAEVIRLTEKGSAVDWAALDLLMTKITHDPQTLEAELTVPEFTTDPAKKWFLGITMVATAIPGVFKVGVRAGAVATGSPALAAGLRAGDILYTINDERVAGPTDVTRLIAASNGIINLTFWQERSRSMQTIKALALSPTPLTYPPPPKPPAPAPRPTYAALAYNYYAGVNRITPVEGDYPTQNAVLAAIARHVPSGYGWEIIRGGCLALAFTTFPRLDVVTLSYGTAFSKNFHYQNYPGYSQHALRRLAEDDARGKCYGQLLVCAKVASACSER